MTPVDLLALKCSDITPSRLVGVYFLISNGVVVYVGQSTDVENRVSCHHREGTKTFDRVLWFPVEQADLMAYEAAFVRALDPVLTFVAHIDDSRDAEILSQFGMTPNAEARAAFTARRSARWLDRKRTA